MKFFRNLFVNIFLIKIKLKDNLKQKEGNGLTRSLIKVSFFAFIPGYFLLNQYKYYLEKSPEYLRE
jgi:hypothetical protein